MITIVDSMPGSGKTSWCIESLLDKYFEKNIMYLAPYLKEIDRVNERVKHRKLISPKNKGDGKLGNIVDLITWQEDIGSTHELFRRFDKRCIEALRENPYTLILDETLSAVEPYHFSNEDDFEYLKRNHDIFVNDDGLIEWTGSELNTRFNDVRVLATNKCLYKIDDSFFLWQFPPQIFELFEDIYICTYMFDGSLMKYYFDLYSLEYQMKSISDDGGCYKLVDYYKPSKTQLQNRIAIYEGKYNYNISQKNNVLSANWTNSICNRDDVARIQSNFRLFAREYVKAKSDDIMWTCYQQFKHRLKGKGYTKGFVSCNARATNDFKDKTCLMYGLNWYENPEIMKFFTMRGVTVDQDKTALSTMIQWVWRSNIRESNSDKQIDIYIPSRRMRELFKRWLYDDVDSLQEAA